MEKELVEKIISYKKNNEFKYYPWDFLTKKDLYLAIYNKISTVSSIIQYYPFWDPIKYLNEIKEQYKWESKFLEFLVKDDKEFESNFFHELKTKILSRKEFTKEIINTFKNNKKNEIRSYNCFLGPKINVFFEFEGRTINLVANYEATIDKLLKRYCITMNAPERLNDHRIYFYFNSKEVKFGDNTTMQNLGKSLHINVVFPYYLLAGY